MTTKLIRNAISVRTSSVHGFGVFADQDIEEGDILEEGFVLTLPEHNTQLKNYTFAIPPRDDVPVDKRDLIVLGYGSIYNHSNHPNANVVFDHERFIMRYIAATSIRCDDEIFIYYGKYWFQERHLTPKMSFIGRIRNFIRVHRYLFRAILLTVFFLSIAVLCRQIGGY